ncbi:Rab geranylgeranyltransferase [Coemansia sp. RSA 986]|nr:Rab geranylgeranyltransferase [Coemansia sp. RSA 986]
MDQNNTLQEQQTDQPPEVLPGQQIPELNTLNPPLNHRTQDLSARAENLEILESRTRSATDQPGFSSSEGQQFYSDLILEEDDDEIIIGLDGNYGGNDESEESSDDSTGDDTSDESDGLASRNEPYNTDGHHTPPQPYHDIGSLDPLTISDDAPDPQSEFSRGIGERVSSSEDVDEYIAINTQLSPQIHRRADPSRVANSNGNTISLDSSSSSSSDRNGRMVTAVTATVAAAAAEKRRHSRRESATNGSQTGANKRRRQSRLPVIAEDDGIAAGTSMLSVPTDTAVRPNGLEGNRGLRPRIMFKCAVCLDVPDPAVFIHPCGHVFCEGCAQGAVQTTRRCPVCRHHMRQKDIHVLQFRIARHGRRRQAAKEPTVDEKEQNRQRVEKYCALNELVMQNKAQSVYTHEALEATQRLLELNTELHTVWNYRREIFVRLAEWQDTDQRQAILEKELAFLLEIILKNIKSYWMWFHRVWALVSLPMPAWERELALVAKMLSHDARNYHGWDYRRFVVARLKESLDTETQRDEVDAREFAFTTEQINKDCANHSAWHNRTKLLPAIMRKAGGDAEQQAVLKKEFYMILNAIYTDPDDQNGWLYYDWLLDTQKDEHEKIKLLQDKVAAIRELLDLEEDSKRPMIELVGTLVALESIAPNLVSNEEKKKCLATLQRLEKIDTYHVGRYRDMSNDLDKRWA